jgi:predicted DNA-binding transcriptional regulator YafY
MPNVHQQPLSRPPWGRMMRLHQMLQRNEYPNCPKLARELEISVRTLKRDVVFMRDRLELPIEYDAKKYGYYYRKPVDQFPGLPFSESEIFALLIASKAIAQYQGTELQIPLQNAFKKLTGQLDQGNRLWLGNLDAAMSFRPFAPADADLQVFQDLTTALKESREVCFEYKNLGAKRFQNRLVRPYHLACIENHWYLFAYDLDRKAMRTFALTRLAKLTTTKKRFVRDRRFNPDEYLSGSFQVFKGEADADYEVVVDFDEWATDLLRGRKWHRSQKITELADGKSRLTFRLNNLEEIEGWILSHRNHAVVVRPEELRQRITKTLQSLVQRYADTNLSFSSHGEEFAALKPKASGSR